VVNWNGSSRATSIFSSSQVKATINASDVATAGTAWVTVVNPGPGGGTSNVVYFPIRNSSPSVELGTIDTNLEFSANDLVVGDFNKDGNLDVIMTEDGQIQIYPGNGDGTFQSPINFGPAYNYNGLAVGDFNNDGNLDLIVWSNHHEGIVFLGQGNGHFVKKHTMPAPNGGYYTTVADLNGDGNLDLCLVGYQNDYGGEVSVLLGNGDGTFRSSGFFAYTNDGGYGLAAIGDFNGGGKLDLAVPDNGVVDIFPGNGDGTFQNPASYQTAYGAGGAVTTGDVNNDGKLDLITSAGSVLLGRGDGTFESEGGFDASGSVYFGDFNGDGFIDVAGGFSSDGNATIDVFLGNGNGTFQNPVEFPLGGTGGTVIGDFNNDGLLDVIAETDYNYSPVLQVFLQNGISLSPRALAYGDQTVGTTSPPQTVVLTNYGSSALPIEGTAIVTPSTTVLNAVPQFAQTNNCGTSLPASSSCQLQVTFTPEGVGNWSAWLSVSYQGAGSPQTVLLTGTGASAPTVSLTPSSMTFTTQLINTTSPQQTATLTNTGTQQVTINSISATPPFAQTNNCPSTLNENASCQIQLTFTPTGPGNAPGTLSVSDNALGSPQTVSLTGTGTVVVFSPISVNFGDQQVGTNSSPVPITLTNEWSQALSISQIQIAGNDPQDFSQTNNCGSSVPAGSYCTFMVTFTPTQTGQRSAQLSVSDNGGASPQTVPLTGTGT
jgi:hypothetical protein